MSPGADFEMPKGIRPSCGTRHNGARKRETFAKLRVAIAPAPCPHSSVNEPSGRKAVANGCKTGFVRGAPGEGTPARDHARDPLPGGDEHNRGGSLLNAGPRRTLFQTAACTSRNVWKCVKASRVRESPVMSKPYRPKASRSGPKNRCRCHGPIPTRENSVPEAMGRPGATSRTTSRTSCRTSLCIMGAASARDSEVRMQTGSSC